MNASHLPYRSIIDREFRSGARDCEPLQPVNRRGRLHITGIFVSQLSFILHIVELDESQLALFVIKVGAVRAKICLLMLRTVNACPRRPQTIYVAVMSVKKRIARREQQIPHVAAWAKRVVSIGMRAAIGSTGLARPSSAECKEVRDEQRGPHVYAGIGQRPVTRREVPPVRPIQALSRRCEDGRYNAAI